MLTADAMIAQITEMYVMYVVVALGLHAVNCLPKGSWTKKGAGGRRQKHRG